MLTHVDVFLGVAMVMLGVSLLVTIATQIVSTLLNLRGEQLKHGLIDLFAEVGISSPQPVVEAILHHKLIANGGSTRWTARLAPAISKVDLLNLLGNAQTYLNQSSEVARFLQDKRAEIDKWFDATMARVANRFTVRTRVVTVIGAVLAAFLLHLDAFGLVSRLYADSDLRAKLAGAADGFVSRSEAVLATPTVFTNVASTLGKTFPELGPPSKTLVSRGDVETWIRTAVPDPVKAAPIEAKLDALIKDAVKPALQSWLGEATDIDARLAGAGFQLVVSPYRPFHYDTFWVFLGVLASAALLSLGAPFWFNALKTVSNLRPAIAAAVEDRDQPTSGQG
jgi:hypothetical protein